VIVEAKYSFLAPLAALAELKKGREAYCLELRKSDDIYLSVNAWITLIEARFLTKRPDLWDEMVGMCGYRSLRLKAFEFFENEVFEHELAARVAAFTIGPFLEASADKMRAELGFNFSSALSADGRAFLATGDRKWLGEAHSDGEYAGGQKQSLPWAIRGMMLDPTSMVWHERILHEMDISGDAELLGAYANIFAENELFPPVVELFRAAAEFYQGKSRDAVSRLTRLAGAPAMSHPSFRPLTTPMFQFKARAEEKLGLFSAACGDYLAMNQSGIPDGVDPDDFYRRTDAKRQLKVPLLPADPRTDVVQMLGFARSGTTLLENVLGAHPDVETFEEIPALTAAIDVVELVLRDRAERPATLVDMYLNARAKYYEEIDIRRQKVGAKVLVDKMPLRGSEAGFLSKLFPEWRYIFAIRHPFDVVLSCFKQRFAPNPAMENFRTIAGVARAYDLTMSEWFAFHTLDEPAVHYVRYDDLVTDFETVMTGTLDFLGLGWEESVRDFAQAAQTRASRTPSYQKVRQGLGIGVQTYWRDYKFVFDTPAAAPLFKWAEFFGYPTA
jgi:hypothetical protein